MAGPLPQSPDTPRTATHGIGIAVLLERALHGLLGLERGTLARHARLALLLCAAIALCNAVASCSDVQSYGGTDLRARVVGSRALLMGLDPYLLPPARIEPLRDPHRSLAEVSRCTYTPALLLATAPLSLLPYPAQRHLHAALEWAALLSAIGLLARAVPRGPPRAAFGAVALAAFAGGASWRLHVERGQYYVLVLLLAALLLRELRRAAGARPCVLGALCAGVVLVRPNWAPLLVLLVLLGQRRAALWAVGLGAAVVAAITLALGPDLWLSYLRMVELWSRAILATAFPAEAAGLTHAPPSPGGDGFMPAILPIRTANLTFLQAMADVRALLPEGLPPAGLRALNTALLGLCALAPCALGWARRATLAPGNGLLMFGAFLLLSDFFAPLRIEYADVLFLLPLALLVPWLARPGRAVLAAALLLVLALPALPLAQLGATAGAWPVALRAFVLIAVLAEAVLPRRSWATFGEP